MTKRNLYRTVLLIMLFSLFVNSPFTLLAQEGDGEAEDEGPICLEFMDSPTNVRTGYYMGQGAAYMTSQLYLQAIASFTCVIDEIDAQYVDAYVNRAIAYVARRDYEHALEDYTTVIDMDSSLYPAHNNRAIVYAAMGEYEMALDDFNRTLDLNSDFVAGYNNRGIIHAVMGDYTGAIADFEQAIDVSDIDEVYAALLDPEIDDPEPGTYDPRDSYSYALLGVIYSAYALDNYQTYLRMTGSSADRRIQGAAGALESRFTFELRLDDGTWLYTASFTEEN